MKSAVINYRAIKADAAIHDHRPAWAAMAEVLVGVPEGMDPFAVENEITDAVLAAGKNAKLTWDGEQLNLLFDEAGRPDMTLYSRVIVKGLVQVTRDEVKVGDAVHGIGSPLAALLIAADFVQIFSLSQRSALLTDARAARAKGLVEEAKTIEAAVAAWVQMEKVYTVRDWAYPGPVIANVKVSGYRANRHQDGCVDAEVTFTAQREDGREASLFAPIKLKQDARGLFGVSSWERPMEWCAKPALLTLGDDALIALLAEAIDEAVSQYRCRDEVA